MRVWSRRPDRLADLERPDDKRPNGALKPDAAGEEEGIRTGARMARRMGVSPGRAQKLWFRYGHGPGPLGAVPSPHNNNAAEPGMCDTAVLHRSVRHRLSGRGGREVFSVPVSVARTCQKMGMFPRMAVENAIKDPDWRISKPPDCPERAELSVQAATTTPSAAAIAAVC